MKTNADNITTEIWRTSEKRWSVKEGAREGDCGNERGRSRETEKKKRRQKLKEIERKKKKDIEKGEH